MRFPPGCLRHVALLLCVSCLVDLCVEPASCAAGEVEGRSEGAGGGLGGLPGGLSCRLLSGVPRSPAPHPRIMQHHGGNPPALNLGPWEHAQHVNVHLSAFLLSSGVLFSTSNQSPLQHAHSSLTRFRIL